MANKHALHTHLLTLNGVEICKGDNTLRVIFNNLNGENFKKAEPWRDQDHPGYLTVMERELKVSFAPGSELALFMTDAEKAISTYVFPASNAILKDLGP